MITAGGIGLFDPDVGGRQQCGYPVTCLLVLPVPMSFSFSFFFLYFFRAPLRLPWFNLLAFRTELRHLALQLGFIFLQLPGLHHADHTSQRRNGDAVAGGSSPVSTGVS